jgi:uncharacterized repeat protein (TIGR03803 family)
MRPGIEARSINARFVSALRLSLTLMTATVAGPVTASAQADLQFLHNFTAAEGPPSSPLLEAGGHLYGTTSSGGTFNLGTIFTITIDGGAVTILHSFNGAQGSFPSHGLILGSDGYLYGGTEGGGQFGRGTVFRMAPDGMFTSLYSFAAPFGAANKTLAEGVDGNFYGTVAGFDQFDAAIFKMTPAGAVTILYSWHPGYDTASPNPDGLIRVPDGSFYVWTHNFYNTGSIFHLASDGTSLTHVHTFADADQGWPTGITLGADGNLYVSMTGILSSSEFQGDRGRILRMSADGSFTLIYQFTGPPMNSTWPSALLQATDGRFYGTTRTVFGTEAGAVFAMTPDGDVSIIQSFQGNRPSNHPIFEPGPFPLIEASDGKWYGMVRAGGAFGNGAAFRLSPATSSCQYALSPSSATFPADGGTSSAIVTTGAGCNWAAYTSPPSWITLDTGTGSGDGTLSYTVAANPFASMRTGTINLFDRTVVITQDAASCQFGLSPTNETFPSIGGNGSASVTASAIGCSWTASTPAEWIVLGTGGGLDNGTLPFTVRPNTRPLRRTASIAVGSLTFVVTQQPAISGDLDGDSASDLLWHNVSTGETVGWLMNGPAISSSGFLPLIADTNWEIKERGDFDGDARADILWRNKATGQNIAWSMKGLTVAASAFLPTIADTNWEIAGVGDFDGGGKTDVLWRNKATGQLIVWLMDGLAVASSAALPAIGVNWDVKSVADFDGDGKADVLLRNTSTGQNIVWLMNGTSVSVSAGLPAVADTNWEIVGSGDLDGGGKAGIVWRHNSTGQIIAWLMNGATVSSSAVLATVGDLNWEIAAVRDLDGDGRAEIVWRNHVTGENAAWSTDGSRIISASLLTAVADLNWRMVGR